MTISGRRFSHFGEMLKFLRETYGDRMHERNVFVPRGIKLTALGLVESLNEEGYEISPSTYSEIEAGATFPRYARKFLTTVCTCLGLEIGGPQWRALNQQLARDLVRERLGDDIAELAVGDVVM